MRARQWQTVSRKYSSVKLNNEARQVCLIFKLKGNVSKVDNFKKFIMSSRIVLYKYSLIVRT